MEDDEEYRRTILDKVIYLAGQIEYHIRILLERLQKPAEQLNSLVSLTSVINSREDWNSKVKPETISQKKSANKKPEIPTYDGSSSWNLFIERFEAFAELNELPFFDYAKWLLLCLNGPALEVLNELSSKDRQQYGKIVKILNRKFGNAEKETKLCRLMLKMRQQKRYETLTEFCEDVQRLAARAYPDAPIELLEYLTIQAFIDGLENAETKKALILADHVLISSALIDAIKFESCSARSCSRAANISPQLSHISAFACDNYELPTLEPLDLSKDFK